MSIKTICVYCGSSLGTSQKNIDAAKNFGSLMVEQGITLVYGGGNIGLMGVIANEVLQLGGQVIGVIPQQLADRELAHDKLSALHIVSDMHERKATMASLADAFIALPGGMGTLEELFEMLTWSQLGLHNKPIGLLNVDGFYDHLISLLEHMATQEFLRIEHKNLLLIETSPHKLLNALQKK